MAKRYLYKVYDSTGAYIKTWNDVASQFELPEEINTTGSEITVELARPSTALGEGSDIALDNRVKVYVEDDDAAATNGLLVFYGYIIDYSPTYGGNENLKVTLSSFGLDMNEHILDFGNPIVQDIFSTSIDLGSFGFTTALAQSFTPSSDVYVQSVKVWVRTTSDGGAGSRWPVGVSIIQGDPNGVDPESGTALATATEYVDSLGEYTEVELTFDQPILLSASTLYYAEFASTSVSSSYINVYLQASDRSSYSGGGLYTSNAGSPFGASSGYDLRFSINGGTQLIQNSVEVSDMLRNALDVYANQGGQITYSGASIDDTGYIASYTFNGMTLLEIVKKCQELAPPGWFFYVDQATNELHFHKRSATLDHKLVIGKNIQSIQPQKTKRNVVNTVYFIGGNGLYKKYTRGTGATRAIRYVDQRVTREDTADLIANSLLEEKNAPEVRVKVTLVDNNGSSTIGYDIESITVGQNVTFRGVDSSTTSLWDIATWDSSYWDFSLSDIETLVLQIYRIERKPGVATLHMTSLTQDVNKRIEDINRRLVQDQTVDLANTAIVDA